jgi:CDP-glucose 4,6-dehydratase
MNINSDAFRGKNVLVTGHTGFKGSWLSLWMNQLGAKVSGYALNPSTDPNHFELAEIGLLLSHDVRADIRNKEHLRNALKMIQPDIIFHLAAQPLVRASYLNPYESFETNVLGTANLLDVIREERQSCVVIVVTSDKCYLNNNSGERFVETSPLGGSDPYSASKAATEILLESYRSSYFTEETLNHHGVSLASVRAGNVIGGGDWSKDRIVPDLITAFSKDISGKIRNPNSIRPWQHVLEPLCGYMLLAAKMTVDGRNYCSPWNFGPSESNEKSVEELTDVISKNWPNSKWELIHGDEINNESKVLKLSSSKAARELQWFPTWDFEKTISETVDWYKKYYFEKPQSMYSTSIKTIENFTKQES